MGKKNVKLDKKNMGAMQAGTIKNVKMKKKKKKEKKKKKTKKRKNGKKSRLPFASRKKNMYSASAEPLRLIGWL